MLPTVEGETDDRIVLVDSAIETPLHNVVSIIIVLPILRLGFCDWCVTSNRQLVRELSTAPDKKLVCELADRLNRKE